MNHKTFEVDFQLLADNNLRYLECGKDAAKPPIKKTLMDYEEFEEDFQKWIDENDPNSTMSKELQEVYYLDYLQNGPILAKLPSKKNFMFENFKCLIIDKNGIKDSNLGDVVVGNNIRKIKNEVTIE